jgi:hypothetical protein
MVNGPFQLLRRNQEFAEGGVHPGLARIQARDLGERFLVIQHVLEDGSKDFAALREGSLFPFLLGLLGTSNGSIDALGGGRVNEAEKFAGCGVVALDRRGARDLGGLLAEETKEDLRAMYLDIRRGELLSLPPFGALLGDCNVERDWSFGVWP